jgi:hypothetical protein
LQHRAGDHAERRTVDAQPRYQPGGHDAGDQADIMADDGERRQSEAVAAVEHGGGHAAGRQDDRLDQHQAGERHGEPAGQRIEARGQNLADECGRHELSGGDNRGKDRQERTQDEADQALTGRVALFAYGGQQHRNHGAGERAAGDQTEKRVRQPERSVVGDGVRAGAELDIEEHLSHGSQQGGAEEGGHQDHAGLGHTQLALE